MSSSNNGNNTVVILVVMPGLETRSRLGSGDRRTLGPGGPPYHVGCMKWFGRSAHEGKAQQDGSTPGHQGRKADMRDLRMVAGFGALSSHGYKGSSLSYWERHTVHVHCVLGNTPG